MVLHFLETGKYATLQQAGNSIRSATHERIQNQIVSTGEIPHQRAHQVDRLFSRVPPVAL